MSELDIIVVGAGPAGSVAARELARSGASVAVVDGSFPREKPCGGGVTARALVLVEPGMPELSRSGQAISSLKFEAGGAAAEVAVASSSALEVFSRDAFDSALLRQATLAGAQHFNARVRTIFRDAHLGGREGWRIHLSDGSSLRAPWLLGADGASGVVRRQVFRPFERRHLSIAAGAYVDGLDCHQIVIGFVDRPRGYLWSFPRPGHLAVGACAQADETSTAEMHAIADRWLDSYPPAARLPRRRYAWPIPSLAASDFESERPSGTGWMLLGDAAGLVDPITREGIYFALRSGMLAAEALTRPSASDLYSAAIRDELHAELRRAAMLKAGVFGPRFTRLLIDALNTSGAIRDVMLDLAAGRQPYRGLKRRLIRTWELRVMLRLLFHRAT